MIDPIRNAEAHSAGGPLKPTGASNQEKAQFKAASMRMQLNSDTSSTKVVKASTRFPDHVGPLRTELPKMLQFVNQPFKRL